MEAMSLISAQIHHMLERYEKVLVGWHCAKVKGRLQLKILIEKHRVKTFISDFPKLHHSNPNSFSANVHLRQFFLKTVKVIERSRGVTQRSPYEESKGHPRSPCAPYMMQFRPLFTKLWHFGKKISAPFFLIGHLESVGRAKPVFEFNLAPS